MSTMLARSIPSTGPVSVAWPRWQPRRAGLLNVWQYTDEVLEFEKGRLVLYGPNGSGKTMALELLLPHLLDARSLPSRLSTSGADRGGLWDRVSGYDEGQPRTGYLWLEFERESRSEGPLGPRHEPSTTFTAGVRLRAKPSGGGDKHWFTTSRRVNVDFSLLDQGRRPLTVEQLGEAVGAGGRVWGADTAGYRQAVRTTLFPGWSDDRFDALVRTLLVVRKQNVTDGLSPGRLSVLLSEALPPLDELELARVADGFADLDRRRDHIAQLEHDVAETRRMAQANRNYARAVTTRVVGEVVSATTAFDNVTRDVRRLSELLEACNARVGELQMRDDALESEDRRLGGQLDGLKSSEAYKHGAELENLRQAAQGADHRAQQAERESEDALARAEDRTARANDARAALSLAARQQRQARQQLEDAATSLGAQMLQELATDALVAATNTWIDGRQQAIYQVRRQLHALELAIERRKGAQQQQTGCEAQLSTAEEKLHLAVRAADAAHTRWQDAAASWRREARQLGPYLDDFDSPKTALNRVSEAQRRAEEPLIEQRSRIDHSDATLETEITALRDERDSWVAGKDPEPESPAGRRDRTGLSGAPLWRSVQFRSQVPERVRGNVESALADSGLLDAWISTDGRISIAEGEADVQLVLAQHDAALSLSDDQPSDDQESGSVADSLASLLEPDPATDALGHELIERLLCSFGLADRDAHLAAAPPGGVLIGLDGSWRTPRLAGRARPDAARFIGASSRAATRRARIAALDREIAERQGQQQALRDERRTLQVRIERCADEVRAFPKTDEIEGTERDVERERARTQWARDALLQANAALSTANEQVDEQQRELHSVATRHDLPTDGARLDAVEQRLTSVRDSAFVFQKRLERAESARRHAVLAQDLADESLREASERTTLARERRGEADEAAGRYAAVEKAVGSEYRDVLEEIRAVAGRQAEIRDEQRAVRTQRSEAVEQKGSASSALAEAERRRATAAQQRTRTDEGFAALCRDGLVVDAAIADPPAPEALSSTTAILEAARRLRASGALASSPPSDAELVRLSNTVMARLGDASRQLAGRADLTIETSDHGWSVLRARREGMVVLASGLLAGLGDDLAAAHAELSQKQQELFEQILSGSVREHLKERLWAAQELVDRINALLQQVRTESGGVMVSLKWEVDPDSSEAAELRQAKELLLHDSPVAEGRGQLDNFLRGRIERVRAAQDDTGEWKDRLARMLDYRSWHRFRVLVHHRRFGERPRPLDSRKVSLSAGEKTIVMVLPLLAAVTAHYEPAPGEPPCVSPRLLLMDELFPKLDFPNKRKLMGLLPRLALDAVFTSDKDRCEYDTLDGIAIAVCQKLGDDKTTTTQLVWNGTRIRVAEHTGEAGQAHDGQAHDGTLTRVEG